MTWQKIVVDIIIGLTTGILASIITNVLIERRIKKKDDYKNQLIGIYKFFMRFESRGSKISVDEIQKVLVECRVLFKQDSELSNLFKSIDVTLSTLIRLHGDNNAISFNFDSEEYEKFIETLDKRIG